MDYKEAIEILHPDTTAKKLIEIEYYNGFSGKAACIEAVNEASVVACEAMEKQIPKKGVRTWFETVKTHWCSCPSCLCGLGWIHGEGTKNYCPSCGQKLDWSE